MENMKDEAMSHTPTPWAFHETVPRTIRLKRKLWQVGGGPDNKGVALVFGDDEANAEFIVRACNCHEEMLKQLDDAFAWLMEIAQFNEAAHAALVQTRGDRDLNCMRSAIAKAEAK